MLAVEVQLRRHMMERKQAIQSVQYIGFVAGVWRSLKKLLSDVDLVIRDAWLGAPDNEVLPRV